MDLYQIKNSEKFYTYVRKLSTDAIKRLITIEYEYMKGDSEWIPFMGEHGSIEFVASLLLRNFAQGENNMKLVLSCELAFLHAFNCQSAGMYSDNMDTIINNASGISYDEWSKVYRYLKDEHVNWIHQYEFLNGNEEKYNNFEYEKHYTEFLDKIKSFKTLEEYKRYCKDMRLNFYIISNYIETENDSDYEYNEDKLYKEVEHMACYKCGSEWINRSDEKIGENCPFCGVDLKEQDGDFIVRNIEKKIVKVSKGTRRIVNDEKDEESNPNNYVGAVDLPEGIIEIGDYSFYNFYELKFVQLPNTLKRIGNFSFLNTSLEEIRLPEGLKEIGENAFKGAQLKEIVIPESVEEIGEDAFAEMCFMDENGTWEECSEPIKCIVKKGSFAELYARGYGYEVKYMESNKHLPFN
ncbi:MAG: hypothetical protein K0R92_3043 [Lachnospiraceae bacterium]|jgi:hypothetical protein|nr:hypothetical protein [Lachnospiraceae bacterium]